MDVAATVVIATFNRIESLRRLLGQLDGQALPPARFEVIVVDDGSAIPVPPALQGSSYPFALRAEVQANAGAGAARHRGALAARGEILIFVDDDMQVGPGFVEGHLAAHDGAQRRLVLGHIRPAEPRERMTLPERWHQHHFDRLAARARGGEKLPGNVLYSGNFSLRKDDYLAVGGFDATLREMEDRELGVRLEEAGFHTVVTDAGYSINSAEEVSAARWLRRVPTFGRFDQRVGKKHPAAAGANPWRILERWRQPLQPVLLGAALFPGLARVGGSLGYAVASVADRLGSERLAFHLVSLVFGLLYYRGVREEMGSAAKVLASARQHLLGSGSVSAGLRRLVAWLAPELGRSDGPR